MKRFYSQGYTLLELLVTIVVIGAVTAIGSAPMKSFFVQNEVRDIAWDLRMSMKLARAEAMTRGVDAILCSTTDLSSCSGVAGNWNQGWLVGVDLNNDGAINEAQNELIKVYDVDDNTQVTVTPNDPAFEHTVRYSYTGWLVDGDDLGFDVCSGYGAVEGYARREIRSSIAGEPKLTKNMVTKC